MKVKFMPSGEEHDIEFNETILHLAQRVGLHIQSVKGFPPVRTAEFKLLMVNTMCFLPIKKKSI